MRSDNEINKKYESWDSLGNRIFFNIEHSRNMKIESRKKTNVKQVLKLNNISLQTGKNEKQITITV